MRTTKILLFITLSLSAFSQCSLVYNPFTNQFNCGGASGTVGGASNLTTVGAIPYVSASGVLNQDPTALFWDAANNRLGVGTASPVAFVDIAPSSSNAGLRVVNAGLNQNPQIRVEGYTSVKMQSLNTATDSRAAIGSESNSALEFIVNNSGVARFATTGNLLIGTTTDSNFKLDVAASGNAGTARFYGGSGVAASTKVVVQAGGGQSGNLQEWQTSGGTAVLQVDSFNQLLYAPLNSSSYSGLTSSGIGLGIGNKVYWTSGTSGNAIDLSLSRASAGVLQVGDGGANANGQVSARAVNAVSSLAAFNSTGGIYMSGNAGSSWGTIQSYSDGSGTAKATAINPTGGNLLIGTTTDDGSNKLQISGSTGTVGAIVKNTVSDGTARLTLSSQFGGSYTNSYIDYSHGTQALKFVSGRPLLGYLSFFTLDGASTEQERMRLTNPGNLLIGTTTDDTVSKLQVVGTYQAAFLAASGSNNNFTKIDSAAGARVYQTNASGTVVNLIQSSSSASYFNAGNVLIGTTTDDGTNKLQVLGSIYSTAGFASYTNDGVFGVNARPFVLGHPGGQQTRIGYFSTGDGNYAGRMAFSSTSTGTAYSFIGNGDQGAYGALVMGASNSEAARFAPTTRNLLIGTTTDSGFKLDVAASGSAGTARFYGGAGVSNSTKVVVQAGGGQSGNLQEWQNSGGNATAWMTNNSYLVVPGVAATSSTLVNAKIALSYATGNDFRLSSDAVMSFNSATNITGTLDLSLSRASAGVLQVGDGGSNANGQINAIRSVLTDTAASGNVLTVYNNNLSNPGEHIRLGYNDSYRWSLSRSISSGNLTFRYQNVAFNANLNSIMELAESGTLSLYNQTATTGVTKAVIRAGAGQSTTNLTEWQNSAGVVLTSVSSSGQLNAASIIGTYDGALIRFGGGGGFSRISSGVDGNLLIQNNAGTSFTSLQFGGTTSSFPALKRSSASLEVKLADDSAFTELALLRSRHNGVTVAALPAAAAGNAGSIQYVTDANATTIGSTVAGGGANKVMVWSDGAAWKIFAN